MARKQLFDANETDVSTDSVATMPATGDIKREDFLDPVIEIETAPANALSDHAAQLAFLEEKVDVMVHESADPNAEPIVETWVNGVAQRFIRGQVQTVRRKYVEVLARAKNTNVTTKESFRNGERGTDILKHTALKYPFSVMRDDNPKGGQWLKGVLAQ